MILKKLLCVQPFCLRQLVVSFAGLLVASCAVGPSFKKPAAPEDASYSKKPLQDPQATEAVHGGGAQHFVLGKDVAFDWWKSFECPPLNRLVESSIKANPSIAAAIAALHQAQELTKAQEGYFFPQVGPGYSFQRQQLAGNLGGNSPGIQGNGTVITTRQTPGLTPANGPTTFNMHTLQLTVGYTIDVFGGNRRQVESLDAQARMQQFELEAAYVTLASNVVGAAVQEASLRGQVTATKDIIAVNQKMLDILKKQFTIGYASRMDLAAQEAQLAQVTATLPPLIKQLALQRDLIAALAGRMPGQAPAESFEMASIHLPRNLPLSLPSKIIEQRPDVRAAEENVRSANAQVGVALANRLPQFTITGGAGGVASEFTQMFFSGGPFWSMTGGVTQTLFDGGTLLHRHRAAIQALVQANAQYKGTVITAYQNVADSLHALEQDGSALQAAVDAERAAKVTLDLTAHQVQTGYANALALLNAEQTYQQAVMNRVQAQANRFADTAALFEALGGGWWNR